MNGLQVIVASLIFSTTLRNVDSRCWLSQSTKSLKKSSSSFQFSSQGGEISGCCFLFGKEVLTTGAPKTSINVLSEELIPEIFDDLFQGSMFVRHSLQKVLCTMREAAPSAPFNCGPSTIRMGYPHGNFDFDMIVMRPVMRVEC